jgi:hypothetical protein
MTYQDIAAKFAELLERELTPQDFAEMRRANAMEYAKGNRGICHSHDYLDANVIMLEAFDTLDVRSPIDFDYGTDEHLKACALWAAAWNCAKSAFLS